MVSIVLRKDLRSKYPLHYSETGRIQREPTFAKPFCSDSDSTVNYCLQRFTLLQEKKPNFYQPYSDIVFERQGQPILILANDSIPWKTDHHSCILVDLDILDTLLFQQKRKEERFSLLLSGTVFALLSVLHSSAS
jgi:hypothetical protein